MKRYYVSWFNSTTQEQQNIFIKAEDKIQAINTAIMYMDNTIQYDYPHTISDIESASIYDMDDIKYLSFDKEKNKFYKNFPGKEPRLYNPELDY